MKAKRFAYGLFGRLPPSLKRWVSIRSVSRFPVGIIGVVTDEAGKLLVFEHTYRPGFEHGLPSGWLRRDDSLAKALRREVLEESGLDVECVRVLKVERNDNPARLDVWLQGRFVGGRFRQSAEVRGVSFHPLEALPPLPRAQREFLTEYSHHLTPGHD